MGSLSRWVVRHRLVVGLVWLVITVVGLLLAPSVTYTPSASFKPAWAVNATKWAEVSVGA